MNKHHLVRLLAYIFFFAVLLFIFVFLSGRQWKADANNDVFPDCAQIQPPGDWASYAEGWHQIAGNGLLWGRDDVYTLGDDGDFLQCFCDPEGEGIQTHWLPDEDGEEWGEDWNLGENYFNYENSEYNCLGDPIPEPTPLPTSTPQPLSQPQPGPAPKCSDPSPVVKPWNCNLYRYPTRVELFWVPGDAALVDVLFKENSPPVWVHSLPGIRNIGRATVSNLIPGESYTFTIKGRNACSGGDNVSCIIVDDPKGFFRTTYWGI